MTLIDIFEENLNKYPNNIAVIYEKQRLTYLKMNTCINKLAQSLISLGFQKGDRAGIYMENSIEYIYILFAVLKCGGVVVPINNFLTENEVEYILSDSKIKILFTCKTCYEKIINLIHKNDFINYSIITDSNISDSKILFFYDLISKTTSQKPDIILDENNLAFLIYTSGTTGYPKGAMLSHKNLVSNIKGCLDACKVNSKDKIIIILPMFHSFTNTVCILLPLSVGARIIIVRTLKPFSRVLKILLLERVTIFVGIPKIFSLLADHNLPWFFKYINPIKICISGAAPLPGEVLNKFENKLNIPLLEGYGLTEASPVVSINPINGIRKPGSIGLPITNVDVKIVNDKIEELPPLKIIGNETEDEKQTKQDKSIGEIIVKGPNVMIGYYNKENETKETIRDGWLYTGDIGFKDEDGYIYIVDRKKDMILVHGMNVYPREIEEIIYKHPAIKEACVIGIKHIHYGEFPKAYIVLNENKKATEKELKEFCKKYLAQYKIPHLFIFMSDLPKTGTGKISKKDIRKLNP
ncbi:MAG: long-chain fatty acid--CoA ligase [Candidatus Firestonebacteria bacterium]|nr:long-chain fatty acid--CoA ligase [Candidatus Firestonebacteria bacterium]